MLRRIPGILLGTLMFAGIFAMLAFGETCQLPATVAVKREAIMNAAKARSPEILAKEADGNGMFFSQGRGKGFASDMRFYQEKFTRDFNDIILHVLSAHCAKVIDAGGQVKYVWPAAAIQPLQALDESGRREVATINASAPEQSYLPTLEGTTSYAGWRITITSEGKWVEFISGE